MMRKFSKQHIYLFLLIGLTLVLFAVNYKADTYLAGWDNIMPEFNVWLNLKRNLTSIWQEYRGLGLLDGMAHSANLVHTLIVAVLAIFMPQNLIRYVVTLLLHLTGGIGLYMLTKRLTKSPAASFVAALFYMLNIGTLQQFFAPLESFSFHFAFLPWLFYGAIEYMTHRKIRYLTLFFIIALLSTPQSFVPTIFVTTCMTFCTLVFYDFFEHRSVKHFAIVFGVFLIANSFWLLPYLYSVPQNAPVIKNARINQFSSDEVFARNRTRGNLLDTIQIKGFMLDIAENDIPHADKIRFMGVWESYSNTPLYIPIYFGFVGLIGFGIYKGLKKHRYFIPFFVSFCIAFFFLGNNIPILNFINDIMRNSFPILAEAFRFPFTKFATIFFFTLSVSLAIGIQEVLLLLKHEKHKNMLPVGLSLLVLILALPAFTGNFFSPLLKVKIPAEYKQLFAYLDKQDESKRIAYLPAYTFWSWQDWNWGYVGSGFIWFGIKQPILVRAFDPWSKYNEQFYNELAYSMNVENIQLFENTLDKYDISYLLLDQHILDNLSGNPINYDKLNRFLAKNTDISVEKQFGDLILYKRNQQHTWTYTLQAPTVGSSYTYSEKDQQYIDLGSYTTDLTKPTYYYPFTTLFTSKLQSDVEYSVKNESNTVTLIPKNQPTLNGSYKIQLPSLFANEFLIPVQIEGQNGTISVRPLYPEIIINGKKVAVKDTTLTVQTKTVKNPTKFTMVDSNNTEVKNHETTYIFNRYLNTIKVSDGKKEELVTINTNGIQDTILDVPISDNNISSVSITFPKIKSLYSIQNAIAQKQYVINYPYGSTDKDGYAHVTTNSTEVKFDNIGKSAELLVSADPLPHEGSYLVLANGKYGSGLPMNFYIDNVYQKRTEIEGRMSQTANQNVFFLPKSEEYYKGYGLHFLSKSLGTDKAQSSLEKVELYPLTADTIRKIRLVRTDGMSNSATRSFITPHKYEYYKYGLSVANADLPLVLSQAYSPGWAAYEVDSGLSKFAPLFGKKISNHILVNNWANGWLLPSRSGEKNTQVMIIYWPQYLQYFGFILIVGTAIFLGTKLLHKHRHRHRTKHPLS